APLVGLRGRPRDGSRVEQRRGLLSERPLAGATSRSHEGPSEEDPALLTPMALRGQGPLPLGQDRGCSLRERRVAVRADLWIHPVEVCSADRASPVESTERDRREDKDERGGIWDLLRQTEERRRDGGHDPEDNERDRHGQLARAERPICAKDLAMHGVIAPRLERRSSKRGRHERATEEREVALDPGDPDKPSDPADRE